MTKAKAVCILALGLEEADFPRYWGKSAFFMPNNLGWVAQWKSAAGAKAPACAIKLQKRGWPVVNMGQMWAGLKEFGGSRADYNLWKQHNPAGNVQAYTDWRKANPDAILPKLPKAPKAAVVAPEIIPGARPKPKESEKSPDLKNFEREGRLAQSDVQFNLYRRSLGRWSWCGTTDTCSREEIAETFGGGRFLVRRIDPTNDQDLLGPGNEVVMDIDKVMFPPLLPPARGGAFGPMAQPGEDAQGTYTIEDLEKAEKDATEKAAQQAKIDALTARAFAPETAPKDSMAILKDVMEIQRLMNPGVNIGEAKAPADPTAPLNSVLALITAGLAIWEKLKPLIPAQAPAGTSMLERLSEKALDGFAQVMANKAAQPQPQAGGKVVEMAPVETEESMFESVTNALKAKLAEGQKKEAETSQDTVMETAHWILAQKGMIWNGIKAKVVNTPEKEVVAYIGTMDPTLTDSDFKKIWLENVCGIIQDLSNPQAAEVAPQAKA